MATQGGPAKAVVVQTGAQSIGGPALPVAVVTDGRAVEGGPAMPVVVVTSGPVQGGPALPVVAASGVQASQVMAGRAIPVYVVSGAFAPVNTVLPAISGSGAVLSSTTGTWTGSPVSYAYQWNRNGVAIGGATSSTYTIGPSDIGATLTVTVTATNASGGSASATSANYTLTYTQKVLATDLTNLLGYWPQAESSGAVATDESGNGRNGAYTAVTLGQAGIGDGRTSASFDGTTSFNNVYSASLAGVFNGSEGTLALWAKVSAAGVWTDGVVRRFITFQADANNRVLIQKDSVNNQMLYLYRSGGTSNSRNKGAVSTTAWFHLAITWSKAADQVKAYFNGVQEGATLSGLGVFAGALNAGATIVGAGDNVPTIVWSGTLAHAAVWDTPLSGAQIAALATV